MSIFVELFSALGLFTSVFIGVVVLCLVLEEVYDGHGYFALSILVAFLIGDHFFGGTAHNYVDLSYKGVGIYIGIGFLYAIIRVFFLGAKTKINDIPAYLKPENIDAWVKEKKNSIIQHNVWRWWINWPFSLIGWILGDVFKWFRTILWKLLKSLFMAVFNLGHKASI
jgi:hypothetical protein